RQAQLLERVLQRQGVDDRAQHAHVVTGGAVEAARGDLLAPEDVPSPHHQRDLDPEVVDALDLAGHAPHDLEVDALAPLAAQRLAAELEEDPTVAGATFAVGVQPLALSDAEAAE